MLLKHLCFFHPLQTGKECILHDVISRFCLGDMEACTTLQFRRQRDLKTAVQSYRTWLKQASLSRKQQINESQRLQIRYLVVTSRIYKLLHDLSVGKLICHLKSLLMLLTDFYSFAE